ncbi:hypothetical protein GCM10027079_34110 [Sediminivirga luteola]|uniref:Uncharacterized protein n=1 Tax=Sediminivirga luteola TaxID=1774748 RepID=A0A8J2TY33_9MICO|nr:hypothetical protein GCM10011333_17030 [Sediminivirga luteola]
MRTVEGVGDLGVGGRRELLDYLAGGWVGHTVQNVISFISGVSTSHATNPQHACRRRVRGSDIRAHGRGDAAAAWTVRACAPSRAATADLSGMSPCLPDILLRASDHL